jgi:hypothetical protein
MFATPAWNNLSAAYDYDAGAPDMKEEPVANDKAMIIKLAFTGPGGKPVSGVFMRPKEDGTYPCAIVAHGLTDVVVVPPAAKLLQAAAPQPKQVVWYSAVGMMLLRRSEHGPWSGWRKS